MAMNFPANPTNGQVYQDYVYDSSTGWRSQVMVGAAPCGSIMPFAGATIPAGWLLCDGAAVSRTTYSSLYAALGGISSPWGQGNGSTTFNLPDLRTRVPVGKNGSGTFSALGAIGGAETMSLQEAHLAAHTHTFSGTTSNTGSHQHAPPVAVVYGGNASTYRSLFATNSGFWSGGDWNNAVTSGGAHDHTYSGTTSSKGSGQAFGLLQPYAVVNYIIKFSAVVAASDTEIATRMGQAEATVNGYDSRLTTAENRVNAIRSGYYIRKIFTEVDTTSRTTGTSWTLMWTGTNQTGFKAGSDIKLTYHMALRNNSSSWGGGYIEPQISFNNSTWFSLGSSGYDGGVMSLDTGTIGSYNNTIIIDPALQGITTDFQVRIRFYAKSYDGTLMWNQDHDINAVSGTATAATGLNLLQHYCNYTIEELATGQG